MKSTLGTASVFHANESRYQQAPLDVLVAQFPVVAGHFSFAQIPEALFADTFFFTFLREPVDRALSHYYYYRTQPESYVGDSRMARARELDLASFVDQLSDRPSPWSNWQTFLFSGATEAETSAADLLPAALRNLERVDFVGIHDQFDAGMRRLFEMRGWPGESVAPRVNITEGRARRDETPASVLRRLQELNACDAELFSYACELWEETKSRRIRRLPATPAAGRDVAATRRARTEQGTREVVFSGMSLRSTPARPDTLIQENDRVSLELRGMSSVSADDLTVGIRITDALGVEVYGVNTRLLGMTVKVREGQTFRTTFSFDMILAPGTYYITVAIHAGDDHLHKCYHWIDNALTIECTRGDGPRYSGLVDLKAVAALG